MKMMPLDQGSSLQGQAKADHLKKVIDILSKDHLNRDLSKESRLMIAIDPL
jgi:hypothetical protein